MSKKVYLVRYGAYGDQIHMSPVLRAFKEEGWDVTFEYNWKGAQVHTYNPFIDHHVPFEPTTAMYNKDQNASYKLHFRHRRIKRDYDKFINFGNSLEKALIAGEDSYEYFMDKRWRDRKFGQISFHDQSIKWAGLPDKYLGRTCEIYFRRKEHDRVKEILQPYKDAGKFIVIWSIAGTMWQKAIYPWSREVIEEFQKRHPNVVVFLTAGKEYAEHGWEGEGLVNCIDKYPFRQVLCMTRYANLVVTPETGLGIGAGAYGTPKIMLMTAANLKNIVGNDKNDFSLQSEAWCSPCHRAIYNTDTCNVNKVKMASGKEVDLPICVFFDKDRVLNQMEKVYGMPDLSNWSSPSDDRPVYM